MTSNNYKLQFITHHNDHYSYIDSARIALKGGCRWIQLRMKDAEESMVTIAQFTSQCRKAALT